LQFYSCEWQCVGRGPSALLWQGAYDAVKTALSDIDGKSSNIMTSNVNILQAFKSSESDNLHKPTVIQIGAIFFLVLLEVLFVSFKYRYPYCFRSPMLSLLQWKKTYLLVILITHVASLLSTSTSTVSLRFSSGNNWCVGEKHGKHS